jgi:hypothetical protein
VVFENFNYAARRVVVASQQAARDDGREQIGTGHLLVALAAPLGTDSVRALELLGINEDEVRARLGIQRQSDRPLPSAHLPFGPDTTQVLRAVAREAVSPGDPEAIIGSGDLLLGLARHENSAGSRVLAELGASYNALRDAVAQAAASADAAAGATTEDFAAASLQPGPGDRHPRSAAGHGRAARVVARCSVVAAVSPDRAWSLLGSPQAWCVGSRECVAFDVPGPDQFRFLIGQHPGRGDPGYLSALFAVTGPPGRHEVSMAACPPGIMSFSLSVGPRRRGRAELRVAAEMAVVPNRTPSQVAADRLRDGLNTWLEAVKSVLEGQAPWPGEAVPVWLLARWAADRTMEQPRIATASDVINGGPEIVWETIHLPWYPQTDPGLPVTYAGRVPGTPAGQVGEMWYFIHRRSDKTLHAHADIVTQSVSQRLTATQSIGPLQIQTTYQLLPQASGTRLQISRRWPAALTAGQEGNLKLLTEEPGKAVAGFKARIEASPGLE